LGCETKCGGGGEEKGRKQSWIKRFRIRIIWCKSEAFGTTIWLCVNNYKVKWERIIKEQ
jgi:hypothetical protein